MTTEDRETKMSKCSELWDRLSELPDTLILHILSSLPMSDVVRTTVLSKRWRGLWTSVPCLLFDAENKSSEEFRNFVNRAMLRWKGTELLKFSVSFCFDSDSFISDIDTWLYVAIEKGVKELSVNLMKGLYSPPQSLYSCSTIRKASLLHCVLKMEGNVQWDQLKSLRIELPQLSEDVIEKVMLGAPHMEILNLIFRDCSENLNIHSNSLKTLKIEKKKSRHRFSTVKIWTPNVETLEISGIYLQGNVSSLTRAKVGLIDPLNFQMESSRVYKVFKGMSGNFFQNFIHLEEVTLSSSSAKVLREIKKENKDIAALLKNVKFLRLYASRVDDFVALLEIFPALSVLVLLRERRKFLDPQFFEIVRSNTTTCISECDAEKSLEPKSNFLMPYLRTVEITWPAHNSVFPFIEILSKNVRKLEKMVLRLTATNSGVPGVPLTLIMASQKLLGVQKAFPAADIIMCQED